MAVFGSVKKTTCVINITFYNKVAFLFTLYRLCEGNHWTTLTGNIKMYLAFVLQHEGWFLLRTMGWFCQEKRWFNFSSNQFSRSNESITMGKFNQKCFLPVFKITEEVFIELWKANETYKRFHITFLKCVNAAEFWSDTWMRPSPLEK